MKISHYRSTSQFCMCRNGVLCVAYKQAHWMTQAWVGTNVASGSEFDLQIHERSHVPPKTARSWRVSAKVIFDYGWLPPDYQLSPAVYIAILLITMQWYIDTLYMKRVSNGICSSWMIPSCKQLRDHGCFERNFRCVHAVAVLVMVSQIKIRAL